MTKFGQLNVEKLNERVENAKKDLNMLIRYGLGEGGFDPKDWCPKLLCDCSGWVSAKLGMSRNQSDKKKPWSEKIPWIETTAIYNDAKGAQLLFVPVVLPVPGCLIVYPDRKILGVRRQGHVGLVISQSLAMDCASGRGARAIQTRPNKFWLDRGGIVVCLKEDLL